MNVTKRTLSTASLAVALALAPLALAQRTAAQMPTLSRAEQQIVARSMEQPQPSAYPVPMPPGITLEVLPVLDNVYLIAGGKSNITVLVGDDGLFVVDSATADVSDQVLTAIGVLSKNPISFIVNTTFDPDHFGGNEKLADAGANPTVARRMLTGPGSTEANGNGGINAARPEGAIILANENTLNRMSAPTGQTSSIPFGMWPSDTFFTPKKTMNFDDQAIELYHPAAAHSDSDVMVFFRKSDVIATGDIIDTNGYASFDAKMGGSINGVVSALNDVIDITVPRFNQMGGTRVVPGHGRILNEADVVEYRDMITIIRDRVQLGIDKGMTLAQIQAEKPTFDYDGLYSKPGLTGQMYVEAIYNSLKK